MECNPNSIAAAQTICSTVIFLDLQRVCAYECSVTLSFLFQPCFMVYRTNFFGGMNPPRFAGVKTFCETLVLIIAADESQKNSISTMPARDHLAARPFVESELLHRNPRARPNLQACRFRETGCRPPSFLTEQESGSIILKRGIASASFLESGLTSRFPSGYFGRHLIW